MLASKDDNRLNFLLNRVDNNWNCLPGHIVMAENVNNFKAHIDNQNKLICTCNLSKTERSSGQ